MATCCITFKECDEGCEHNYCKKLARTIWTEIKPVDVKVKKRRIVCPTTDIEEVVVSQEDMTQPSS